MLNKEFKDMLIELEEKFYNNVLIIKYRNDDYIVSRRWEIKPKNGVLHILVEKLYSEPTPYHVGEVSVLLNELPDDIQLEFFSKISARHFNSSRVTDLQFEVRRL